ncbi:hypothetical protein CP8484711_1299B, partial [Chlamydia psittaci 84-8471/1]
SLNSFLFITNIPASLLTEAIV